MCGGGGTQTTTQQTTIPPEVMARYNKVNEYAESLYNKPFQKYGTEASDFVAQLTPEQKQAIEATGQYANAAQGSYASAQNQLSDAQSQGAAPVELPPGLLCRASAFCMERARTAIPFRVCSTCDWVPGQRQRHSPLRCISETTCAMQGRGAPEGPKHR